MRKYLTRRCIGLHALVLVLVPAFLLAGWWQYHVALSGNDLSWVYTVEWPFFAVYAVYVWWRLIHDESTPFDRLWAAKQRAAADAEGRPLHEIPGWATDKALSREVHRASREAARHPSLFGPHFGALDVQSLDVQSLDVQSLDVQSLDVQSLDVQRLHVQSLDVQRRRPAGLTPDGCDRGDELCTASASPAAMSGEGAADPVGGVIDAQVIEVKANVDEELEAYNRYLFQLSRSGPAKRWGRRTMPDDDVPDQLRAPNPVPVRENPALGPTDRGAD
jgi:hypothetical protein